MIQNILTTVLLLFIYYLIIQLHTIFILYNLPNVNKIIYVIRVRSMFKYANADLITWNSH